MKKETMNMAIERLNEHVEVFCSEQFKGYYVRGVIRLESHEDPYEKDWAAICRHATLALVNDSYQERIKKQWKKDDPPPLLYGNTENDYLKALNTYAKGPGRLVKSYDERIFRSHLHGTLMISLDEAEITNSQYLDDSIKKAKDIILLHEDVVLGEEKTLSRNGRTVDCVERIYNIPVFYFQERDEPKWLLSWNWFEEEYDSFHMDFDCDYPTKREYCRILKSISNLSYEWIKQREITRDYVRKLNRLNKRMNDRTYPLMSFCGQFLDDLVDELTANKVIGKCLHCTDFFRWPKGVPIKKRCSGETDGKNCAKGATNKRYYQKGKLEALEKERRT